MITLEVQEAKVLFSVTDFVNLQHLSYSLVISYDYHDGE